MFQNILKVIYRRHGSDGIATHAAKTAAWTISTPMSTVRSALESSALQALQTRPIANQHRRQKPGTRRRADDGNVQGAARQPQARSSPMQLDATTQRPRIDITA